MSEPRGTFATLLAFVAEALEPLADELATAEGALQLLSDVGLVLDEVPTSVVEISDKAVDVRNGLRALEDASQDEELVKAIELSVSLAVLTEALIRLGPDLIDELGELEAQPAQLDVGKRLLDRLVMDTVDASLPRFFTGLALVGIFEKRLHPEEDSENPSSRPISAP